MAFEYWKGRKKPSDLEKAAMQAANRKQELEIEEARQETLKEKLFKPWKEVSISGEPFHARFIIQDSRLFLGEKTIELCSLTFFEAGREFLSSKNDRTKTIWRIWESIEGLKKEYNSAGKQAQKKICDCLLAAYPSLQSLEAKRVSKEKNCYVIDNIIQLIWFALKEFYLKDGRIDWNSVLLEKEKEGDMWILTSISYRAWRVFVQSRTETDANESYFKKTIENLMLSISENLKQLDELHGKMTRDLSVFREKMSTLVVDIDLHKLDAYTEIEQLPKLDEERLRYRSQLKNEIVRLRLELENVEHPKEIPYPVWLYNYDLEQKRKLIGNDREYELIQGFYDALQNRYDYQRSMDHPDDNFNRLNTKCIDTYDIVMKEVAWQKVSWFSKHVLRMKKEKRVHMSLNVERKLVQALEFLPDHWKTYKKDILNLTLSDFDEKRIRDCIEQINSAISKEAENTFLAHVLLMLRDISNDMTKFCDDLLSFNKSTVFLGGTPTTIDRFIDQTARTLVAQGDDLCKKLKATTPVIKENLFYARYAVPKPMNIDEIIDKQA